MKIAIVVHGRFHAFDLARALIERGHDLTLFTNYPGWAVERFGIDRQWVQSFPLHGVLARLAGRTARFTKLPSFEPLLNRLFGQWAASRLVRESWDVAHCWSSVAEESLRALADRPTLRVVVRGSAHIRAQARLLADESRRVGVPVEAPLPWTVAREEREYGLADCIVVNSSFAYATFVAEGVPPEKLGKMVAGANLLAFRATPAAVEDRCRRIQAGAPLHVLTVGTFSLRKGMWDMAAAIRALDGNRFRFRFVGPIAPDAAALVPHMHSVTFTPKQPQAELVPIYAAGDLFALPTIEDGFPAVLGQAAAAALPILTTPNGAGYDLVRDGSTGWVLPIRDPQAFVDQLRWCDTHRDALAEMVQQSYHQYQPRSWGAAAADLEAIYYKHRDSLNRRKSVDH